MPPRGRPKTGKSRMHAAIDAMKPYGFSNQEVRVKMKQLLKEYGGDDGYPFIESDSYRILLEAILADQEENKVEKSDEGEGSFKDNSIEDRRANVCGELDQPSGSEIGSAALIQADQHLEGEGCSLPSEGNGRGWTDIHMEDDIQVHVDTAPPEKSIPAQRRRPCYGWISDDDEEYSFIILTPMPAVMPPPSSQAANLTARTKPKRKSRWDQRPEDM